MEPARASSGAYGSRAAYGHPWLGRSHSKHQSNWDIRRLHRRPPPCRTRFAPLNQRVALQETCGPCSFCWTHQNRKHRPVRWDRGRRRLNSRGGGCSALLNWSDRARSRPETRGRKVPSPPRHSTEFNCSDIPKGRSRHPTINCVLQRSKRLGSSYTNRGSFKG